MGGTIRADTRKVMAKHSVDEEPPVQTAEWSEKQMEEFANKEDSKK